MENKTCDAASCKRPATHRFSWSNWDGKTVTERVCKAHGETFMGYARFRNSGTLEPLFHIKGVEGTPYTTAARMLWDSGDFTSYRMMPGDTAPTRTPEEVMPQHGNPNRKWVLLYVDDDDALNPNVVRAEVHAAPGSLTRYVESN